MLSTAVECAAAIDAHVSPRLDRVRVAGAVGVDRRPKIGHVSGRAADVLADLDGGADVLAVKVAQLRLGDAAPVGERPAAVAGDGLGPGASGALDELAVSVGRLGLGRADDDLRIRDRGESDARPRCRGAAAFGAKALGIAPAGERSLDRLEITPRVDKQTQDLRGDGIGRAELRGEPAGLGEGPGFSLGKPSHDGIQALVLNLRARVEAHDSLARLGNQDGGGALLLQSDGVGDGGGSGNKVGPAGAALVIDIPRPPDDLKGLGACRAGVRAVAGAKEVEGETLPLDQRRRHPLCVDCASTDRVRHSVRALSAVQVEVEEDSLVAPGQAVDIGIQTPVARVSCILTRHRAASGTRVGVVGSGRRNPELEDKQTERQNKCGEPNRGEAATAPWWRAPGWEGHCCVRLPGI